MIEYIMFMAITITFVFFIRALTKKNNHIKPKIKNNSQKTERQKLIERLTEYELKRRPNLNRKEAEELAMENWERDRR